MTAGKRANSFSDETVVSCISKNSSATSTKATAHKAKRTAAKPKKNGKAKKPKDKPTRPLSGYNLFFQSERKRMLKVLGDLNSDSSKNPQSRFRNIGFADMARHVAEEWKKLDGSAREPFNALAVKEKVRYQALIAKWEEVQKTKSEVVLSQTEEQEVLSSQPALQAVRRVSTDSCSMNVSTINPCFQVDLHTLPICDRRVSTDSCSMNVSTINPCFQVDQHAVPISDLMVLTMHVIEQAKEVLREPIIQASASEMTREFVSRQEDHCISSTHDFVSNVAPIQHEHNLDRREVEWDFQGAYHKRMLPEESLLRSSSVELSQDDYFNLANFLANDQTEAIWEDHNSIQFVPHTA